MADRPGESPAVAAARRAFYVLGTTTLVVVGLSWGRYVFVTLAFAVSSRCFSARSSLPQRRGLKRTGRSFHLSRVLAHRPSRLGGRQPSCQAAR